MGRPISRALPPVPALLQGRWEIGNLYEFKANPDYWGGWKNESHIDGFLWIIKRDNASQLNSLLAGETHIADTIGLNEAEKIRGTEGFNVAENAGIFVNTVKMNTQGKYMSDPNLRMAVAYAFNYEELPKIEDVPVVLMKGPTPLNFPGAVKDLDVPSYNIEKAKEYLKKSQWPDGGITLDYVYVTDLKREEVTGLLLLEGLQELNITLNMKPMLWPDMVASCATPDVGPDMINIYTQPAYLDAPMPISTINITLGNGAAIIPVASTRMKPWTNCSTKPVSLPTRPHVLACMKERID